MILYGLSMLSFRTLYVEVYHIPDTLVDLAKLTFPYIICWGLSNHAVRLHWINHKFPYIICWGLSGILYKAAIRYGKFPYIICWGLSVKKYAGTGTVIGFRTLYVEVYQLCLICGLKVTVCAFPYIICWGLSQQEDILQVLPMKFPYIICWGLSLCSLRNYINGRKFPYIICWGLSLYL